jgi:AraC-like DNA-binding protein
MRGQLFALTGGVASVRGTSGYILFPAHRFGWIPPATQHQLVLHGPAVGSVLCLSQELCSAMPSEPVVFTASRVASALLERIAAQLYGAPLEATGEQRLQVLITELFAGATMPLRIPMPTSEKAARIARAMLLHPGELRSEVEWANWAGMSRRTLIRHFDRSGLSFTEWRQRVRIMAAIELLAKGLPVAEVAGEVGYASVSGFIHRFRLMLDCTPSDFLRPPQGR